MSRQLRGRVNVPGALVEDGDVIVADASGSFITSVLVGRDGTFTLPGNSGGTRLLARIRRPVLAFGMLAMPTDRADVIVDAGTPLLRVTARPRADVTLPSSITMFIDPVAVQGVEALPADLILQRAPGVFDAHYVELPVPPDGVSLQVTAGTYRIGGGHLNYDRPMSTISLPPNVIVHQVLIGPHDESCPGDPWSGFEVIMSDNTELVLVFRAVADSEL